MPTIPHLSVSDQQRFWIKVDCSGGIDACWLWTACGHPYGFFGIRHRQYLAHRVAWSIYNGDIPAGSVIRHRCHTPRCVNVNHLLVGTQRENIQDEIDRGTFVRGERNGKALITDDDARDIVARYAAGEPLLDIAAHYGLTGTSVSEIGLRKTWQHVAPVTAVPKRQVRGSKSGRSRLTEDQVRAIRARYPGETMQKIADAFGVSIGTVQGIVRRTSWSWLT